jgi:hypothetical protein
MQRLFTGRTLSPSSSTSTFGDSVKKIQEFKMQSSRRMLSKLFIGRGVGNDFQLLSHSSMCSSRNNYNFNDSFVQSYARLYSYCAKEFTYRQRKYLE